MRAEDNRSPLHSLLKTLRQFFNPLSPRPLHSSLGFVCRCGRGQSYGSEWLPQIEALPQLTMLLNKKGTPSSIDADVLRSLTDAFMFFLLFLIPSEQFCFMSPPMFNFSERIGAGIGFTRAKRQVWEYDLGIWPCPRVKFMFVSREGMNK